MACGEKGAGAGAGAGFQGDGDIVKCLAMCCIRGANFQKAGD